MPFRFFKKDKLEKMKKKSKSTTDLLEIRKILRLENNLLSAPNDQMKVKSKSRLSLFSTHKSSSAKEERKISDIHGKGSFGTAGDKKRGSIGSSQSGETENGETGNGETENGETGSSESTNLSDTNDSVDSNNNSYDDHDSTVGRKERSASVCVYADIASRERRMSDIEQLDQYIEYHLRRKPDDGSNANRLVCAQLLREGFKKIVQIRHNDSLRPQEKQDISRSMSSLNIASNNSHSNNIANNNSHSNNIANNNNSTSTHFQKNKNNQRQRCSQWSTLSQLHDNRQIPADQEHRRNWASVDSYERDEAVCKRDCHTDFVDNEHGYGRGSDHGDIMTSRDFLRLPKFMTKRRSVPTLIVSQIEIY